MPRIRYDDKQLRPESMVVVEQAQEITASYLAQGYKMTLRQLYYQFVARGMIPNTQKSYDRLGRIIGDARMCGLLDWDSIEDRGRALHKLADWDNPEELIDACVSQFRIDRWANQKYRVEVWVEKQALAGVVEGAADRLRVPAFSCKGYMSLSEMWDAGHNRIRRYLADGQTPVIIHLGDHTRQAST